MCHVVRVVGWDRGRGRGGHVVFALTHACNLAFADSWWRREWTSEVESREIVVAGALFYGIDIDVDIQCLQTSRQSVTIDPNTIVPTLACLCLLYTSPSPRD